MSKLALERIKNINKEKEMQKFGNKRMINIKYL